MPELPEVQALAERLSARLTGLRVRSVVSLQFSALKTVEPAADSLVGQTLRSVDRRGKFLVLDFERVRMLIHFSQGGRLDVEDPPKKTKPKGSILRIVFEAGPSILVKEFGTERKAAWWVFMPGDEGPLEKLGPEPFSDEFASWIMEASDTRRIHTALRDQRTVAGIGRGYADDVLHRACLSPYATLASLDTEKRTTLLDAIRDVLTTALEGERTRTGGLSPKLGDRFIVHGRYGTPCPRCGDDLRRISYEAYEITYCPTCQTNGAILADRRLSRLLR